MSGPDARGVWPLHMLVNPYGHQVGRHRHPQCACYRSSLAHSVARNRHSYVTSVSPSPETRGAMLLGAHGSDLKHRLSARRRLRVEARPNHSPARFDRSQGDAYTEAGGALQRELG